MRPSQNLSPPPQNISPPLDMRLSHNLSRPPRIYLPLRYASLLEFTPPSRIYPPPPFSSLYICDTTIIYPSLPEYTLLQESIWTVGHSRKPPLLPEIYSLFKHLYASLSESTSPSQKIPSVLFYNVILTESTPISCLDKCACSIRHIGPISSLGTHSVQCVNKTAFYKM